MDDPLRVTGSLTIPLREIALRTSRSSGPGGQHANVTASRVEARFDVLASPTLDERQKRTIVGRLGPVVSAIAQDERSQLRNRELALARLAARLSGALAVRRPRRPTRPSRSSVARGQAAKRRTTQRKRERRRPADED